MQEVAMNSVTCRNFTNGGLFIFNCTAVVSMLAIELFLYPGMYGLTKPMVLFLFLPVIMTVFKYILNTLRWLVEYTICKLNGLEHKASVVGYGARVITVDVDGTLYTFKVEREHQKYDQGALLLIKAYKKFVYIEKELKE